MPREQINRLPPIEESAGENKEDLSPPIYSYVFPGQGSKIPEGMGEELYQRSLAARDVFHQADQSLQFPLSKLIRNGLQEDLIDTSNLQPVMFTLSMATLATLKQQSGDKMPTPMYVAGHSAGQIAATVASGAISFEDGIRLARERGNLMKEASRKKEGTMAVIIQLAPFALEEICAETGVEIANFNTPDQTVISGDKLAIVRAIDFAYQRGAKKAALLPVSGAFHHSRLMASARIGFRRAISEIEISDPKYPIVGNTTAEIITKAKDVEKELVIGICKPVLWSDSVVEMTRRGINSFIELGPNRVLSGLVKQINKDVDVFPCNSFDTIANFANLLSQQPATRRPLSA